MKTKIIQLAIFSLLALTMFTGCVTDNGKLPQPTTNYTPKETYAVPYDKLWSVILDALDKNRITTIGVEKESGVIQTDYAAGPGQFMVFASQSTRYKYSITVRNQPDGTVRMNIICKVESSILGSSGSSQWRDVSPQNAALVKKLETWLYEQIEQGL